MLTPLSFPGSTQTRAALKARMGQFKTELESGERPPESGTVYHEAFDTTWEHKRFVRHLGRYEGNTLGEIAASARDVAQLADAKYKRWSYRAEHPYGLQTAVGAAASLSALVSGVAAVGSGGAPLAVLALAGSVGIAAAAFKFPRWLANHNLYRECDAKKVGQHLERWGGVLSGTPIPPPPSRRARGLPPPHFGTPSSGPIGRSASASRRPPAGSTGVGARSSGATAAPRSLDPTGAMSVDELKALKAQIDERLRKATEPTPTVEVQADSVRVGGVTIPRKT
jgi:hypothetical protein